MLKLKNQPSSLFYEDMYKEIEKLMDEMKIFDGVDITINNKPGDELIMKSDESVGYVSYSAKKM